MPERSPEIDKDVGDMSPTFQMDDRPEALVMRRRIGEIILLNMKKFGVALLCSGMTLQSFTPSSENSSSLSTNTSSVGVRAARTRSLIMTALTGAATVALAG